MRALVFGLLLLACGPAADPGTDLEGDAGSDGPPAEVGSCGGPQVNAGVGQGDGLAPLALARCDGSPYQFYGDGEGYCESRLTLLLLASGWCRPCVEETAVLEEELAPFIAERDDVRVVQVLLEDSTYNPATESFCDRWIERFDLSTVDVVRDPAQFTQIYHPSGLLPAAIIVDDAGVIRHVEYGAESGLTSVRAALTQLLGEAG